jgi:hypothetical protein
VASAQITDGSIVDADISGTAAIADSKLATISTAGKVSGAAITSGTIGGTAAFGGSGGVSTTGAITGTGNIIVNGTGAATTELHFSDNDNSNYVGFKAPGAITANRIWVLPAVDGGSGDLLKTDGAGNLSWISGSSPTGAAGGDLTGNFPNPTLSASGVTAGTYPKVAVDAKGRVIGGSSTITATDIADGTIADADISGTAQVATSKLSGAVTSISGHGLGALATLAAVGSSEISDGAVVDADISGTAAISSTKISFAADSISGNAIDGGIVSNFQSTGIDDDATGVAMTLTSSGNVGIGTATPQSALQVSGYMQLDTVSSPPPTTDCDAASEYGRMKVDPTSGSQRLFVCTAIGWSATALADASPAGESAYTTAGTYSFVVPSGVTSIAAVAVGGGGGGGGSPGGSGQSSGGGGGGALVWGNSIPVTPGETLTVVVGAGGAGGSSSGVAGGYSEIKRGATVLMRANGGAAGQQSAATAAGGAANIGGYPYNTGGGSGGAGGPGNAGNGGGGGGGAGGYSGNGGNGGYQATAATAGAGGGGGGGGESEAATSKPGGGGVGLLGLGTSGAAGAMDGGGGGGSSGQDGSATAAGTYGGGGGGVEDDTVGSGSAGARGAVRVIWGAGRSFPSNAN